MHRRGYVLRSVWHLPAAPARCWQVLADPSMTWPTWWPRMSAEQVHVAAGGTVGSHAVLRFRSPFGYGLAVQLTVTAVEPGRLVALDVGGDLEGRAEVRVGVDDAGSTRVGVLWDVRTERAWMNATGPLLAPLFAYAHSHVMAAGERGLVRHLTAEV